MALTDPHAVQLIDEVVQGNKRLLLGLVRVMVQGLERARLVEVIPAEHWLVAGYEPLPNTVLEDARTEALKRTVHAQFSRVIDIAPYLGEELHEVLVGITEG